MTDPNDPRWRRFEATHQGAAKSAGTGIPTLGVGSFVCNGCGKNHVVIATVMSNGYEVSLCLPPEEAEKVAMEMLTRTAELQGTN